MVAVLKDLAFTSLYLLSSSKRMLAGGAPLIPAKVVEKVCLQLSAHTGRSLAGFRSNG